ncbi:MAG TPA: polysaccharide deacetylase family protein [Vicinamibacteria bacterium]|nr:polysaccharide deacetylase family protein [Vicinamibacteria bacterium]
MTSALPLKRALAWCLLRSGALHLQRSLFGRGQAVLLLYHRVNDEDDPYFPALPRRLLCAQLDYAASHYRVEPLEGVVGWLANGAEGRTRVAITIDDGYPDTLDVLLPELRRRGLPATLFLSTGPPETGEPLWIDRTRWIVKHARVPGLDLPLLGLGKWSLEGPGARLALLSRLLRRLKTLDSGEIARALDQIERALEPEGPRLRQLSWTDVRGLVAGPIGLGAHTHRHYILSRLSEREQEDEVSTSVRLIQERTGLRVKSFAYPNGEPGDYDDRTIAVLRRLGLQCAVTCRHGLARPGHDSFQLPRLYTTEPSLALFAARLAGLSQEEPPETRVS